MDVQDLKMNVCSEQDGWSVRIFNELFNYGS